MRQFIVLGHRAPTTPEFSLDALPSEAGRLDVLCRCVTSSLLTSHGVREDARISLVLRDEFTVTFEGSTVRNLNPDERSTAARIRDALETREEAVGHVEVGVSPGVTISRKDLETTLAEAAADGTVVQLHPDGDAITALEPPADPVFVLSDHRNFTDAERTLVDEHDDHRISLGPERLHADQSITVAHNYLDTAGYTRY